MVETHLEALENQELQYNGDVWTLTGLVEIERNGEQLRLEARKKKRVRGNTGYLTFVSETSPASINPGNPGELTGEIEPTDGAYSLRIERPHGTTRYRLESLRYA